MRTIVISLLVCAVLVLFAFAAFNRLNPRHVDRDDILEAPLVESVLEAISPSFATDHRGTTNCVLFVNLADFACPSCQTGIENFLEVLNADVDFRNRTVLFVTHPDEATSQLRARAWLEETSSRLLLPRSAQVDYRSLSEGRYHQSSVSVFDTTGKRLATFVVPFRAQEVIPWLRSAIK